ncbi:MAG: molybdopterin molybdenumtransferase MoeA, partial [Polynucleobacter sp.]|nr:molybdopterin molybdenumtransferase MoeA [Polynucleobacter sp.]
MLTAQEALDHLLPHAQAVDEVERVATQVALGRVLAADLASLVDVPPLDNSSMDGYAIRCADLSEVDMTLQVGQRIPAGSVGQALQAKQAARIFTGAPIPTG